MTALTNALITVMCINAMLFLGQAAVLGINPEAQNFFNEDGSILAAFDSGNYTLNDTQTEGRLAGNTGSVSPTTGNIFTDMFTAIKNWFLNSAGVKYVFGILGAPYKFLSILGLPQAFTFALGALWYGVTFFLLIAFLFGRDA